MYIRGLITEFEKTAVELAPRNEHGVFRIMFNGIIIADNLSLWGLGQEVLDRVGQDDDSLLNDLVSPIEGCVGAFVVKDGVRTEAYPIGKTNASFNVTNFPIRELGPADL